MGQYLMGLPIHSDIGFVGGLMVRRSFTALPGKRQILMGSGVVTRLNTLGGLRGVLVGEAATCASFSFAPVTSRHFRRQGAPHRNDLRVQSRSF